MDLHPLFVHFPIALLTLYSLLEVIKVFTKNSHWVTVRAVLVITGAIGAFMSLSTGEGAEHQFHGVGELRRILEVHSLMGVVTTWIYAILAACYVLYWLETHTALLGSPHEKLAKPVAIARRIAERILGSVLAPMLAALGFLTLGLTGALGAMLVYGPDFDFITQLVYKLLF
ncbi:MAG: hypothetical protein KC680_02370 [Candidatus Peregrinibacteria bacterium]|nr:hypothetical protein [Candidatus Peregrinibacteria bacterium]MCB9808264.1 hypothetical protein [Candidatus Peribacteria bacterium]